MFANKYEEASYKERLAFNTLIKEEGLFKDGYTVNSTPYIGMDEYDFYIHRINKSFSITKRIFIEVKIRSLKGTKLNDARENGYILESKKFNSLKKLSQIDPDSSIVYVCFTNDGTYFFDLKKLELEGKLKKTKMLMNSYTMEKERGKENKTVYLLKPELAFRHFDFVWSDDMFNMDMEKHRIIKEKKNIIVKDDIDMFTKLINSLCK